MMSVWAVPIFAVAVFATGIFFLRKGSRWRRSGTTPHCAACDYVLTGINVERCPECGATLDRLGIAIGERYRRRRLTLVGVCLILLSVLVTGGFVSGIHRSIDWYRYRPTVWVIGDLSKSNSARAIDELRRRDAEGTLSQKNRDRVVAIALAAQASSSINPMLSSYLDFLGHAAVADQLSVAQRKQFFDQIVSITLAARPQVGIGRDAPYQMSYAARLPSGGWWANVSSYEASFDGKTDLGGGSSSFSGNGGAGSHGSSIKARTLGHHPLTARAKLQVYQNGNFNKGNSTLLYEHDFELKTDVEVLPAAPSVIRQIADASLAPTLSKSLRAADFRTNGAGISGKIEVVSPLPIDVAFDVVFRIAGREFPAGSVHFKSGASGSSYLFHGDVGNDVLLKADALDVILRSSEKVAFQAIGISQIWEGELVYLNVPWVRPVTMPVQ